MTALPTALGPDGRPAGPPDRRSARVLADSLTMFRRNVIHLRRFPVMTISQALVPAFMLLLFVYVLGGAMGSALPPGHRYVDYLVPGLLVMAVGGAASNAAINVNADMTENIVARFRTMPIARASVLAGEVLAGVLRTALCLVLVIAASLLVGFRTSAGPVAWLALLGLLLLLTFAVTWIGVGAGLAAKNQGSANSIGLPMQFLPFTSSAFAPTATMSPGVRWFAENQPFTPIIDTVRGLLAGTPIGHSGWLAVGWCLALTALGYAWSLRAYTRDPKR